MFVNFFTASSNLILPSIVFTIFEWLGLKTDHLDEFW